MCALSVGALALTTPGQAQDAPIDVREFTLGDQQAANIKFWLPELSKITDLRLDSSEDLELWSPENHAELFWNPASRLFELTTQPAGAGKPRKFFKLEATASDTAPDVDGDNLSDFAEGLIGTDSDESPTSFDTDGDAVGDGFELAHGSDPLNQDSIPDLPLISFSKANSLGDEGDGVLQIELVSTAAFSGTVNFRVNPISTTSAADFISVPNSRSVTFESTGSTATISFPLTDDAEIENIEALVIDLVPGSGYFPIGRITHVVLLHDNDNYWSGVMVTDVTEQPFRLCLIRQGATVTGSLVSDPVAASSSVPAGTYPLTDLTFDPDSATFDATAANLPVGSSQLFGSPNTTREIRFTATPGGDPYSFEANSITGTVIDSGSGALSWTKSAEFALIKVLPTFDKPAIPVITAP